MKQARPTLEISVENMERLPYPSAPLIVLSASLLTTAVLGPEISQMWVLPCGAQTTEDGPAKR